MVIAGLKTLAERKKEAQRILDWGFRQFKPVTAYAANDQVGARACLGRRAQLGRPRDAPGRAVALSSAELQDRQRIDLLYRGPLMAPVKAGEQAGRVRFSVSGNTIAEFPLETAAPVGAVESMWDKALDIDPDADLRRMT